ncbi:MAG: PQQ-binding-like beta-propeller repeat protein [Candidatus Saliniplasma sp.]
MRYSSNILKNSAVFVIVLLILFSSLAILANISSVESRNPSNDSPWPCFKQNPQRTGSVNEDSNSIELNEDWNTSLDMGNQPNIVGSPVITADGDILQPAGDTLFSINDEGEVNWDHSFGSTMESTPTIADDGTIYIGLKDANLTALNPDGTEKWRFTTENRIDSSPAIGPEGNIYFGNNDGVLYNVNPEGEKEWNISFESQDETRMIQSSPAIDEEGTIYIASTRLNQQGYLDQGRVHAVNPNGTEKWRFEIRLAIISSPAIGSEGNIYIGGAGGHLFAIDLETGEEVWKFGTAGPVLSSPAIDSEGRVYVGSNDNKLYVVNSDGNEIWNFTTKAPIFSSPAISQDGTIYVGSRDKKLYAINPNGTQKWNHTTDSQIFSSPAIGEDGSVYITSYDGVLYGFYPSEKPFDITDMHIYIMIGVIVAVGFVSTYYFKDRKDS